MADNSKIKVPGYVQRVFYNDGIEYRPFFELNEAPQTNSDETSVFTNGNFKITTNLDSRLSKNFISNKFSNFITLSDLNLTSEESVELLDNNAKIYLNLDKTNLNNYAYFGSLVEFIRVSLENIIINFPASLYITPNITNNNIFAPITAYTVQDYYYNIITDSSTFKVNTNTITNNFQLNYLLNGEIINSFSETNDLRNLTVNYQSYSILNNNIEYDVLKFTGSTNLLNDFIYFEVDGNPFSGITSNTTQNYHIKPNTILTEKFFNSLDVFEAYLLNRQSLPLYTAIFKYPIKSDEGVLLYRTNSFTWPVNDGYNIDFNTTNYIDYAEKLLELATDFDNYKSDIINRFLVSQSISDFDSLPSENQDSETAGQKMNKVLRIYGRQFDEIRNYIEGISFANVVTYNKQNNTPDLVLKNLARTLGWDLISAISDNNLLTDYITPTQSTFSGYSIGYTPIEAENELYRRLILNTPWIWKSKGTRKTIEFLFKFFGTPNGLINFNEYIYIAKESINIELFKELLRLNNLDDDISQYNLDDNGYPKLFPNTKDLYFQKGGGWYRQTGGSGSTLDINSGNNPHIGQYDNGYEYINQFNNLIPSFSSVTITSQTITTSSENLFVNYNFGTVDNCNNPAYVMPNIELLTDNNLDLSGCYVVTSEIIDNPFPTYQTTDCGCQSSDCDESLKLCIKKNTNTTSATTLCINSINSININSDGYYDFFYNQYDINNILLPTPRPSVYSNPECCKTLFGEPELYTEYDLNNSITNVGYICCSTKPKTCGCLITCKWILATTKISYLPIILGDTYLEFVTPDNKKRVVSPDGCNCIAGLTTAVPNITDPYTNEIGYGCKLNQGGFDDLVLPLVSQVMYNTYIERNKGSIPCNGIATVAINNSSESSSSS